MPAKRTISQLALILTLILFFPEKTLANLHWETIFYSDVVFQYTTSNSGIPDPNWRNPDFDDSGWKLGEGGIGYSDEDDKTIIDATIALFLRHTFTVSDKTEIERAILSIDYDDAFVAYLNGTEIARSKGLSIGFPDFDEISTHLHEAVVKQGGKPESFIVEKDQIAKLLQTGDNVLAVEVHNAGINSSDMSSTLFFSVELNTDETRYLATPSWFEIPIDFSGSNLPVFVINTYGNTIIDDPKTDAHLGVIYNGPGQRNRLTDPFNDYDGVIGIELRGNSTQSFPKKPYSFETRKETGENYDVALLGFPRENDWILRASYYDHTFIRNPLAHHMSRIMGNWSSGNKHCEVVLNGEYQGVYILLEKIKRTKNRLNLEKLTRNEISGEEITGGYIYEIAGQTDHFGEARRLRYPNFEEVAPEQLSYIKKYDNDFRKVMETLSSEDPASIYNEWIDLQSFVDYMLVQEATRNPDGYGWSCYFHKDKNGKLKAGPVWDFDQALNNSTYRDGDRWYGWSIDYQLWPDPPFYMKMIHEPYFESQMKKRWETLRENEFRTDNLFYYIDSIAESLSEATERNFEKWPTLGHQIWRELPGFNLLDTYPKQISNLKSYLEKRLNWIDQELAKVSVYAVVEKIQNETELILYPNPAKTHLNVDITLSHNEPVELSIYNSLGQKIQQIKTIPHFAGKNHHRIHLAQNILPGVYILQVRIGNSKIITQRFIKGN